MHERNDQTLNRQAHGRAAFGTRHAEVGLDKLLAQLETSAGTVEVEFDTLHGGEVSIAHHDPLFRRLEQAWNSQDRSGPRNVHQRFVELAEDSPVGRFDAVQRRQLVRDFMRLAAEALEVLADGQPAEVASLEEHALRLNFHTNSEELT